jgi:molybdate transport system substrate-binding protein
MRNLTWFMAGLVALAAIWGTPRAGRADVSVSAAVSLKGVLEQMQPELEKAAGEKIVFNFGASGTLAGQIKQGAPVDLFISADRVNADTLVKEKLADAASEAVVAKNALVLAVPATKGVATSALVSGFADLKKDAVKKVAVGEPRVVPAGEYAKETLTKLGLWDDLEKAGKLVMGANVAAVLTYVKRGEVDAGLVYKTDAMEAGDAVKVVATADEKTHAPIEYVGVIVAASGKKDAAAAIQKQLVSDAAQKALEDAGFVRAAEPPTTQEKKPQ